MVYELKVQARQPVEGVRTIRSVGLSESFFEEMNETSRVTRRSYGIRLLFHQRGVIGRSRT